MPNQESINTKAINPLVLFAPSTSFTSLVASQLLLHLPVEHSVQSQLTNSLVAVPRYSFYIFYQDFFEPIPYYN